ncbi:MAG: MarC family protein [Candidatus Omnitrophota bacterium]
MLKIFEPYILAFIPIFVAFDAIANIPIYLALVEKDSEKQRKKIVRDAVVTATSAAIIFMSIGKAILTILGITIPDFQIAGGVLLFVISMRLLLPNGEKSVLTHAHDREVGIFPLGTPLITGPAVLTTTLIILDSYGLAATFVSLLLNMFIVWLTLIKADYIMKFIGPSGIRAFSKIMYILLAAIAIMMIRRGILGAFLR